RRSTSARRSAAGRPSRSEYGRREWGRRASSSSSSCASVTGSWRRQRASSAATTTNRGTASKWRNGGAGGWRGAGLPRSSRLEGQRLFVFGDRLANLLERASDETGDVHLRDPDLLRDLRLRQAVEEAELQNLPLTLVQGFEAGSKYGAIFRDLVLMFLGAERLERIEVVVVASPTADRQRERRVRAARFDRLEH